MKNQWVPNVTGHVRIKVSGKYPEMFINHCTKQNIQVWNIQRVGDDVLLCSVMLDEVSQLRKIARSTNCKISFIEKNGFPFFVQKLWRRKGIVIGAIVFLCLLFVLSNMVWGVNIEGASPKVEHELEQSIKQLGIKRGAFQFKIPPPEKIQSIVTDEVEDATWIGVEKKGTVYHFQVVEKEIAEREPLEAPGHIIASRKAVIYDYFVEEGKPLIEMNQLVKKGDILVSGLIGKEGEEEKVPAKGKILGEMWFETKVEIPIERILYAATGEKYRKHLLNIGNWSIPFWGWNPPDYDHWKKETNESSWSIFGIKLPFHYAYTDMLETKKIEEESAVEEAVSLAKEKGRKEILNQSKDGEIIGEKVLHQEVEDGKVIVIIHYRMVDEIGVKQPIIQGD